MLRLIFVLALLSQLTETVMIGKRESSSPSKKAAVIPAKPADSRAVINAPIKMAEDGKTATIDLDAHESDKLLMRWAEQGLSSLMATFATAKLNRLPASHRDKHEKCAKSAQSIKDHARCVLELTWMRPPPPGEHLRPPRIRKHRRTRHLPRGRHGRRIGAFTVRAKREIPTVKQQKKYELMSAMEQSPFSVLAQRLTSFVRAVKNKPKERTKNWGEVIEDIHESAKKMKTASAVKGMFEKRLRLLQGEDIEGKKITESELEKQLDLTPQEKAMRKPMQLLREGVKLGVALAGGNTTGIDEKTISVISPKLLSIFPDEDEENGKKIGLLSPSLFSLHNGTKRTQLEKATSLTDGLLADHHGADHRELLNFIMEASGVTDAVQYLKEEKIQEMLHKRDLRNDKGDPLYFTKQNVSDMFGGKETKKIEAFEHLDQSYTAKQMDILKSTGFTSMTEEQKRAFYGESAPFENPGALQRFQDITDNEVHKEIQRMVTGIASGEIGIKPYELSPATRGHRGKRAIVSSPVAFTVFYHASEALSQPLILSPVIFSAIIESPIIFGPVILSPWAFIPLILSPRLLSPVILNPFMFIPVVLSPLVLHPFILCPGTLNIFVLSPFVMAPFILSPQAITPLILSPTVLNPLILNPLAMSPIVLSPSVLSPVIYSPQYFTASVLSPVLLSPLIGPAGEGVQVIGSPSLLS